MGREDKVSKVEVDHVIIRNLDERLKPPPLFFYCAKEVEAFGWSSNRNNVTVNYEITMKRK